MTAIGNAGSGGGRDILRNLAITENNRFELFDALKTTNPSAPTTSFFLLYNGRCMTTHDSFPWSMISQKIELPVSTTRRIKL
jgi:hypothetical protein